MSKCGKVLMQALFSFLLLVDALEVSGADQEEEEEEEASLSSPKQIMCSTNLINKMSINVLVTLTCDVCSSTYLMSVWYPWGRKL